MLTRIAREIEVVEAETGVSPLEIGDWRALRSERPDLGLYAANSVVRFRIMPWRDLVASDRSWPSDIDGWVAKKVADSGDYESAKTEMYWRRVLTRIAREIELVEAAGFSPPLMREWEAVRVDHPEMFKADSVSRFQIMSWRDLVDPNRAWPSDIEALVQRMAAP